MVGNLPSSLKLDSAVTEYMLSTDVSNSEHSLHGTACMGLGGAAIGGCWKCSKALPNVRPTVAASQLSEHDTAKTCACAHSHGRAYVWRTEGRARCQVSHVGQRMLGRMARLTKSRIGGNEKHKYVALKGTTTREQCAVVASGLKSTLVVLSEVSWGLSPSRVEEADGGEFARRQGWGLGVQPASRLSPQCPQCNSTQLAALGVPPHELKPREGGHPTSKRAETHINHELHALLQVTKLFKVAVRSLFCIMKFSKNRWAALQW